MMDLRPYQQRAHDAAWSWMRRSLDPWLIDAATGAGKSHIIAALTDTVRRATGKRVLVLQPKAELVTQNREKYLLTGNPASVYSASAGGKSMAHPVVFGTPGTVKGRVGRFGAEFALVIVDEAHGFTPTVQHIINRMRECNPRIRVGGLTATPYRLGSGYIFRMDENGEPMGDHACRDPFFMSRVCRITAHELIGQGYLTPPIVGAIHAGGYDTSGLMLNSRGQWDTATVDRAFIGHGRKTAAIVGDVVAQSAQRRGVMLFAATVRHAAEVMASLPPSMSAVVTGATSTAERKQIIEAFKARRIKYLVNVDVLTTGFDAPHVDVIALLRATESVGLMQQIIGRGLRLEDGKTDCLVLDYAGNVDRHCPDGDLFAPVIRASVGKREAEIVRCECPDCGTEQEFTARPNPERFEHDRAGYFVDLNGTRLAEEIPAHFGRRCQAWLRMPSGEHAQCGYRWTGKNCPTCDADNDIAARYCRECKAELVDPNEKLASEFKAMKRDPSQVQTDEVLQMQTRHGVSKAGNNMVTVTYTTPWRTFSAYLLPDAKWPKVAQRYRDWMAATEGGKTAPKTITYHKPHDKPYDVLAYDREPDMLNEAA